MAGEKIATLVATLIADATGWVAGLGKAEASLNSFGGRVQSTTRGVKTAMAETQASVKGVSTAFAGATSWLLPLGVALSFKSAVDNAREFEQHINTIAAISRGSASDMAKLESVIRGVGLATGAGANETSDAANELIRVTGSFGETIGSLQQVVILARATGESVAIASKVALHSLKDFEIGTDHMADVVNGAAGVVKHSMIGTLEQYADALGGAGKVSHVFGVSLDDFNATIGVLSSSFTSGQTTANGFKSLLISLVAPGHSARKAMEDLGISAFDATGHFVGMVSVAQQLHDKIGALSPALQDAALKQIFSNRGIIAATALMNEGGAALKQYRDEKIKDADATAIATGRWKGLNGELSRLSAQWQELSIVLGESGVDKFFATIVSGTAFAVAEIGELIRVLGHVPGAINVSGNAGELQKQLAEQQKILAAATAERDAIKSKDDFVRMPDDLRHSQHQQEANIAKAQANIAALQDAIGAVGALAGSAFGDTFAHPKLDPRKLTKEQIAAIAASGDGGLDEETMRQLLGGNGAGGAKLTPHEKAMREFDSSFKQSGAAEKYQATIEKLIALRAKLPEKSGEIDAMLGRESADFITATASANDLSKELAEFQNKSPKIFADLTGHMAKDMAEIAAHPKDAQKAFDDLTASVNRLMDVLENRHEKTEVGKVLDDLRGDLMTAREKADLERSQQLATLNLGERFGELGIGEKAKLQQRIGQMYREALGFSPSISESVDQSVRNVEGALRDAWVHGGTWDDLKQSLGEEWRSVLWDVFVGDEVHSMMLKIAEKLKSMLGGIKGATSGGSLGGSLGGIGGIFSGIAHFVGSLFSGGHAAGGSIPPGHWGIVGEKGPEPAFGGSSGLSIWPNATLAGGQAAHAPMHGGAPAISIVVHANDAVMASDIYAKIGQAAAQAVAVSRRLAQTDSARLASQKIR